MELFRRYSSKKRHDCELCRIPPITPLPPLEIAFRRHLGDKGGDKGLVKERIDELISIELPSPDTRNNCHCANNSTGYIPIVTRFDCYLTNEICVKKNRDRG